MRRLWRWFWGPSWAGMQARDAAAERRNNIALVRGIDRYLIEDAARAKRDGRHA
ncbi:hypothetical protein [Luteimonas fraxinea]|uniref:Uncharacterized protein n=1 Tax=Luteimonas fraxinea TaxID=2901869 RepID=A0ABS8UDE6_9GAMM|nr:hypothetical protein [Luteimonas fraxinea]MCD9097079.1 hypothetical protein [Luteimonas fraxinea]